MKKRLLALSGFLFAAFATTHAQSNFTADLELIFRDTTRNFIIDPGDSADINFAVVNHGPDDVDTNGYVVFGMTGIPPNFFLVVQDDDGALVPINSGDTVLSRGLRFTNDEPTEEDVVANYCFFLRVNEDVDSFVYDPNQLNDIICFSVTFKGTGPTSSIAGSNKAAARLSVSPNPATDHVSIAIGSSEKEAARVRVYSIDGRTVHTEEAVMDKNSPLFLDIQGWTKGLYFVEVQTEKTKYTGRFVVQ